MNATTKDHFFNEAAIAGMLAAPPPTWTIMPKGSERAEHRGATLDAWRVGEGARWTVLGPDGVYAAGGVAYSMACARGASREAWDTILFRKPL